MKSVDGPCAEFRSSRGVMALTFLGSLLFVAGGVWVARDPSHGLLTLVGGSFIVVVFGLFGGLAGLDLVRPRTRFTMDAAGLHSRQTLGGSGFDLPWFELAGVRVVMMGRTPMIVINPRDPEWGFAGATHLGRPLMRANRALVGSWMALSARTFGVRTEALVAEIERCRPQSA